MEPEKLLPTTLFQQTPPTLSNPQENHSLITWVQWYYHLEVKASSLKTQQAKKADLSKFVRFYQNHLGHDDIRRWFKPITRDFQRYLQNLSIAGKTYKATTINRILATIKHFAGWLVARYPLLDGNPAASIKDLIIEEPKWSGLTDKQIDALKKACEYRLKHCAAKYQNPSLERAVFYCLLYTGLRRNELSQINLSQYQQGAFYDVKRKNNRITRTIPLPSFVMAYLDAYLAQRIHQGLEPLFLSRYGNRLSGADIRYICQRLSKTALYYLDEDSFQLTPHQLRHTFLKRITDKKGLNYAKELSGNISVKEIFRYARTNKEKLKKCVQDLFN